MEKKIARKLTHNLGYKIAAILLAVILWLVVVNIDDPNKTDTIVNIPINILNSETIKDQGKVYTIISSETAYVKVKGPRSYVDELKISDFEAVADFSTLSITNAVTVNVNWSESGKINSKRVDILESTTTINIELEDIKSKSFEVVVSYVGEPALGYVVNKSTLSPVSVILSAPKSVLKNVSTISVAVDVTGKTEDFIATAVPQIFNEAGEEIFQDENTTLNNNLITANVQIFKTKTVPIIVSSTGVPELGYELSILALSNESVVIKGMEQDINNVFSITIPADRINISEANINKEFYVDLNDYLPDDIYLNFETANSITVTAYIVKQGERILSVKAADIDLSKRPASTTATIISDVNKLYYYYTLRGDFDLFDVNQVSVYVDLSAAVKGVTKDYDLQFYLPAGVELVTSDKISVKVEEATTE